MFLTINKGASKNSDKWGGAGKEEGGRRVGGRKVGGRQQGGKKRVGENKELGQHW